MKRTIIAVCFVALVFIAGSAFAEDLSFSLGIKGWYNSWDSVSSTGDVFDNGSALLLGPSAKLTYGGFFTGISFLTTMDDYTYDYASGDQLVQDRNDLDLVIGYMIFPRFGIMAGYKSIASSADIVDTFDNTYHIWDFSISGKAIGVTGNYPIGDSGLVLIGSASYLMLSGEYEYDPLVGGGSDKDDMTGFSVEIGAAYAFGEKLSGNIGWKSQTLSYDTWEGDEKFAGLTFGLDYRF